MKYHENTWPFAVEETACQLALKLTDKDSYVPVPTRLADLETHVERGKHI